jgi:tRNA A-37 threonylcarbamoyl transferase component Bud32
MNNVMLGMLGIAEIAVILLVLLFMAGLAVGVVLLVVWLARRQQNPPTNPAPVHSENQKTPGKTGKFPFAEMRAGQVRIRWRRYIAGLAAVVIGGALLNGLLLAAGVWSGVDTVLFGLLVAVVVFHLFVIRDFHRAGRAGVANPSGPPSATRSEHQDAPGKSRRFSFAEVRAEGARVRWDTYLLGLVAVVFGSTLLNVLLKAAGVWIEPETVLFNILVAVVVFHLFVIRDFHRAGRAAQPNPVPHGGVPPANPTPPPPTSANCPRCGTTLPADSPQGLCPRCVLGVGLDTQTEATGEFGTHGTKIVPPPEAEVARRFPHLEILGCLGHGGMGVVYKARQSKLNRLVALKILAPEKGADPKFAERFLREAQALARLSHPNIVTVHDYGEADGMFFLLMEFVDGMTLRQLLSESRMKPEQALAIVPPICEALQFAHEQGVVHRDIKPENVLLDKQGRVKIADFGIAKLVGMEKPRAALTEERSVIGTPHYMAPEQVEKPTTVDHRADIYSLGVVFYEMLTGELPLGKFQPPSKKVQVDVRLDEVVLHALEKEPERRYQHASQVKTDVETIAATPLPRSSGRESAPSEAARLPAAVDASRNAKEATIVFAGMGFFLFLLAVVLELSRASVVPFKGFLILNCILGLVICALSLAGIWPFPSPWFPEPNFSSRNLRRHKATAGSEAEQSPRFSRTAIVGAAWSPLFFIAAVLFLTVSTRVVVGPGNLPLGPAWWQVLLSFTLLPLGLTAPFGTTILGTVAISQIRQSRGRLYGLGLAVFDALFFPLLLLDALIIGAGFIALRVHTSAQMAAQIARGPTVVSPVWASYWWLGLVVLGIIVLVDWLIIRAVWRAANKPLEGKPSAAGETGAAAQSRPDSNGLGHFFAGRSWHLGILAGLALVAGLIAWGVWERRSPVSAEAVVRIEQKLARELRDKLQEADFGVASVAVNIDPARRDRAECVVSGLVKFEGLRPQEPGIQRLYSEAHGGGTFRHEGGGLWAFSGSGALQRLRFHVDASAQLTPIPKPFRYAEPDAEHSSESWVKLASSFGPEREFTLTEFNNMDGREGLDLDTGTVLAQPKDLEQWSEAELAQWIKDQGVDLFVDHGPGGQWGLVTTTAAELKLANVTNDNRARITERELEETLLSGPAPTHVPPRGILKVYPLPKDSPTAMTLAFKTSSGSSGLLWIAGFTDHPRGVKIRYKLVQAADAKSTVAPRTTGAAGTGPCVRWLESNHMLGVDRWQVERSAPHRLVCGILDITDADHPKAVLSVLEPRAVTATNRLTLRLEHSGARLRLGIEGPHWLAEGGDTNVAFVDVESFPHAELRVAVRSQAATLSAEHYQVLAEADLIAYVGSFEVVARRLQFVMRSASAEDRVKVVLGDGDAAQYVVAGRLTAKTIALAPPERYGKSPFGPVMERIVQTRLSGTTNWFLDLESGQFFMPPPELAELLTSATGPRSLEGLPGTRQEQFADWANKTGVDLLVWGPTSLQTVGGIWVKTHGPSYENWDDLDWQQPAAARRAIQDCEEEMRRLSPQERASRYGIGPHTVLARNFSVIYFFKTQQGTIGVLQIAGTNSNPTGMKIRYKLVLSASTGTETPAPQSDGVKEMTLELPIKAGGLDETSQFKATLPGLELITAKLHFHPGTERTRLMIGLRFTSQSVRSARLDVALLDSSAKDARTIHRFTHVEEVGPEEVRRKSEESADWVRRWDSSRALWFDVPIEARKAQAIQIKVQLQQDTPEEKSAVRQRPDPYRKQRLLAESMKNLKLDQTYVPGEKVELVLATNEATRLEFADNAAGVSEFLFQYEPDTLNVLYNCKGEDHDWTVLTTKRTADSRNLSKAGARVWMNCATEWRLEEGKAHVTFLAKLLSEEEVRQINERNRDELARRNQQRLESLRRVLEWQNDQTVSPIRMFIPTREDPDLTALRTQYDLEKVVAGATDDYEQLQRLVKWAHDRWQHTGDNTPSKPDPLTILAEAAQGRQFRCVEYAIVVAGCAQALGMPARVLALKREDVETAQAGAGHLVAEVWLKTRKKWVFADGQWDAIPEKDGVPLNAVEFQDAFAHHAPGLTIRSSSNADTDGYLRWVVPYLYYFDFNLSQNLFGTDSDHAEKRRYDPMRGKIMLVPKGAKQPAVFQRTSPIKNCTYLSSPRAFYAAPMADPSP